MIQEMRILNKSEDAFFLLGESPVSECYVPTFWNTVLGVVNRRITWTPNNLLTPPMKMESVPNIST
jgi:hypothetical protein